jgi:dolichol-phosphate mannosyltransferase
MTLNYLLKVRSTAVAARRTCGVRIYRDLAVVTLMALFMRGGVLGLLTQTWGWSAPVAIVLAIAAGWAVTSAGYAQVLTVGDADTRRRVLIWSLIAYAFVLRLVYLGCVELLPEETYYWNYSRHLDLSYLDHPPMVAWLIGLGTAVFGQSEFGVRVGAMGCAVLTSLFAYRLTRNLFGEAAALAALLLVQILPFFFLSGLLMTPDAPLTAAWAASLYFLERALVANRSTAWWRAGMSLGLGVISKYSIGLLAPVTLAYMLWDAKSRRWWGRWEPYAAALIALAVFSPVIIWNAQHEWASFAFQTSRRLAEAPRFALHKLIASTLVLITPVGVLAVASGLIRGAPAGAPAGAPPDQARGWTFVRAAVLIPLTVFALFSLRHEVKLDWTGAPWTGALPVMAVGMMARAAAGGAAGGMRAWLRGAWTPTLMTLLLIYGAGLHYLVLGLPGAGYGRHIELTPVGWRDFSRQITAKAADIARQTGEEPLIVGMDRYAIASEIAFYGAAQTHAPVTTSSAHLFEGIGLMYERWTPAAAQEGRTLLLVAWDPADLTGKYVEPHAQRFGPIGDGVLQRDGKIIRHYSYRIAYHYLHNPRQMPAREVP